MLPGQENASNEPLQPLKSGRSRKTPQPELLPQRSSRRTPKPEKTQAQRLSRKIPAKGVTKKRGRPVRKAISDQLDDTSMSRVTHADEEGISTKKRKPDKFQKEKEGVLASVAPEVQGDGTGTTDAAPSVGPSTGIKKRKKRKSIGQQSTSRAKAAKARSPLKSARQSRKRMSKPDPAEATELDGALATNEVQKGLQADLAPVDGGEPRHLPEIADILDTGLDNVEPSAEKLQPGIAQSLKKRKRVAVEKASKKRIKLSSTQSERAPKASKTQKEVMPTEDAIDAVQTRENPAEVEAGSFSDAHEEPEAAADVVEPRKGRPRKRKRVTVSPKPKKRVKASNTSTYRKFHAREEDSTAEDALEATHRVGKLGEVHAGSMSHVAGGQEATAEEEPQPQNPKPKRKKRKSIGQQKPKKKAVDSLTSNTTAKTAAAHLVATRDELNNKPRPKRGRPKAKPPPQEDIEEPQAESLGHLPEEEGEIQSPEPGPKTKPKTKRGRPKANPSSGHAVGEPGEKARIHAPEIEEAVETPILPEKKKRGRPRKADAAQPTSPPTRPTKAPASRKQRSKPAPSAPTNRAPPKNTVPITIYAPPSPTTSDAEDDPLSTSHPHPTTTTTNAIDVLSQLCSELLSKSSSTLADQARSDPSPTKRAELKRTKHTTDLYAQELASRLLQLTTTLNANTSLQARVRAAAKEERRLKKELKELEREREDVRVRKEEVMKARKKGELEELLSGIAGAVKRGWDMQKEGEGEDAVVGTVEEVDLEV